MHVLIENKKQTKKQQIDKTGTFYQNKLHFFGCLND